MKNSLSSEFMFQLFALLTAIILVHAVYVAVIRPSADAQLAAQAAAQEAGEEVVPQRTIAVVIRDLEQEACFILLLWALILATLITFWRIRPVAGYLLAPYLLWVSFAALLNLTLWQLNPSML